jgi:hypothetical protein
MRKLIKLLVISVFVFTAHLSNAQVKHSFSFEPKVVIGKPMNEFGGDMFSANAVYLYNITSRLSIGAGAGIGSADAFRSWSATNLLDDETKRDNAMMYSIFARGKFRFRTNPTSFFLLLDIGYNSASLESWNAESYNALGFFASPQLGIDIGLPNTNRIFFSIGVQGQNAQYNEVTYKPSSGSNKMLYDSFSIQSSGFTGLVIMAGYSFN